MQVSSRVLLVDQDVDALSELASKLRDRGIRVSLANGAQMACERAKSGAFDVVLAARGIAEPEDGSMGVVDALSIELLDVPPILVLLDSGEVTSESRVARGDVDQIAVRIGELSKSADRQGASSLAPSAHTLEHASLADLLLVLGTEKRSGSLSITTAKGSGEVRLVAGEVVDAVYVRLEGKKAIGRLIGEREGIATFTPGAPAIMRRIHEGTRELVAEARELSEKAAQLHVQAKVLSTTTLLAVEGTPLDDLSEIDGHVINRLRVPALLREVLDELPHSDADLLASVLKLHADNRIRSLGHAESRVQLCGADQLHLLRAAASRSRVPGFPGPARLVFAATPSRLAVFAHTVISLADAFPPEERMASLPVPFTIATIRLGDGVELEIVALPLVPAYAPLWPLALGGASVLVRLDEAAAQPLGEACSSVNVPVLDARAIFGVLEETSAVQVASLIKNALEADGVIAN